MTKFVVIPTQQISTDQIAKICCHSDWHTCYTAGWVFLYHTERGSCYPSAPNHTNTRNRSVGTVYLLFTDLSNMERLTSLINPVFSFFGSLVTSDWLTRQLGTVYDYFSVFGQLSWHIQRIGTERSLTSLVSFRDWFNGNRRNMNRYGSGLVGLTISVIICYFVIQKLLWNGIECD